MDDIIHQIIKIDSVAFENKKKNEQFLINKKQEYENIINNYKNEKIAIAKFSADEINKNIEESLKKQEELNNEKINKLTSDMEAKYLTVENELINEIFKKLFVLEG
jgi:gas vesicle protein